MNTHRRSFLMAGTAIAASLTQVGSNRADVKATFDSTNAVGRRIGSIFNNDLDNILHTSSGPKCTPDEYVRVVDAILDLQPGALAQNVGNPDGLIYRTTVTNTFDKHVAEATPFMPPPHKFEGPGSFQWQAQALRALFAAGADPLQLTIDACRKRGVLCLASYRMNAEDYYDGQTLLSDFERAHPEWRIPKRNCMDWAIPQVYEHRMKILREVTEQFDIDGIEFDFRRHHHMVSDPAKNHVVLTRLVRETRQLLDDAARRRGVGRLVLEARVCPSLDTDPSPFVYPGCMYGPRKPYDKSCKELGLDVQTWIAEGLVDAICPSLFLPGLSRIREFVELAKGSSVGVYPTLWAEAPWDMNLLDLDPQAPRPESLNAKTQELLALYKDTLCSQALKIYDEGADGISTYNWAPHHRNGHAANPIPDTDGPDQLILPADQDAILTYLHPLLKSPDLIREYRDQPWAVPPG